MDMAMQQLQMRHQQQKVNQQQEQLQQLNSLPHNQAAINQQRQENLQRQYKNELKNYQGKSTAMPHPQQLQQLEGVRLQNAARNAGTYSYPPPPSHGLPGMYGGGIAGQIAAMKGDTSMIGKGRPKPQPGVDGNWQCPAC